MEIFDNNIFPERTNVYCFQIMLLGIGTEDLGWTGYYNEMVGSYKDVPLASFTGLPSLDLAEYVTNKALDGLFHMVGAEEKQIRTNPAAQTTNLLKKSLR